MMEQFRKPVHYWADYFIRHGAGVQFTIEDLESVGFAGIWRARSKWKPELSSWKTYAPIKAKSAMMDELRALDHVPRLERARARKEGRELPKVETAGRDPQVFDGHDRRASLPPDAAARPEIWRQVSRLLGPRTAEVVERYYRLDQSLKEIGRIMGLSESRVCQIHAHALRRLRLRREESIA